MEKKTAYPSGIQSQRERIILLAINQPLTAKQAAAKTGIPEDTCGYLFCKLAKSGILTCLNPAAENSRLYWLSDLGKKYQMELLGQMDIPYKEFILSGIDWQLYGWICFNHRSAVIAR